MLPNIYIIYMSYNFSLQKCFDPIVSYCELTRLYLYFQLYKHDDPECSELCECNLGEVLSCKVLECIERDACNTGVAFYSHASPFYQAYRGQCLCYSGSFVCSKPPKGNFSSNQLSHLVLLSLANHNIHWAPLPGTLEEQ